MSDTSLNKIIQYGTTAARVAYVPNPAAGSKVLYIWYDTDNVPDTYIWDGAAWVQINPAGGSGDVVGPAVAVNNDIAVFDGTTGKLIKDGSQTIAQVIAASGDVDGPAVAVDDRIATFDGTTGKLIQDGGQTIAQVIAAASGLNELTGDVVAGPGSGAQAAVVATKLRTGTLGISIGNGVDVITTGVKGYVRIPVAITLISWTLLAQDGLTGSIVIDVWADTYANFPPTVADTICNTFKPAISAAIKAEDTAITDWNEAIAAGSVIGFNVDSISTFKKVTLQLTYTID